MNNQNETNQPKAPEPSLGEKRVRTEFNPSKNDVVSLIKQKSAELINMCEYLKTEQGSDARLVSIAQTTYEEAAMWAVKAATS